MAERYPFSSLRGKMVSLFLLSYWWIVLPNSSSLQEKVVRRLTILDAKPG
jgi:hypothetical protein